MVRHKLPSKARFKAQLLTHGTALPEDGNCGQSRGLSPAKGGVWRGAAGNFRIKINQEKNMKVPAALLNEAKANSAERRGRCQPALREMFVVVQSDLSDIQVS